MGYDVKFYKEYLEKVKGFREIPWVKNYIELKKKPNFWTILEYGESVNKDEKKSSYEIRMSRMIRWLLDANENHNLGNLFAYEFLKLMDEKFTYKYNPQKNHHIKAINEALKDIDIFYKDLDKNVCIAIEFKQYSREIIYEDGTSQLNKYKKAVEHFINENKEEITPYYVFLTPKGDPPSVKGCWYAVGYADVIKILDRINNDHLSISEDVYKKDSQKILLDFKEDLQRTIDFIDKGNDAITIKENYSEEEREFTNLLANEITHELDSSHVDELVKVANSDIEEIKEIILILDECVKIQKQDHTPNDAVRLLMRKIFHLLAETPEIPEHLDKEYTRNDPKRFAEIKPEIVEKYKLDVKRIELTEQKGQGIKLHHPNKKSAIYFSGDTHGSFPNDKIHLTKSEEVGKKKISGKITNKTFIIDTDLIDENKLIYKNKEGDKKITIHTLMDFIMEDIKKLNDILNEL